MDERNSVTVKIYGQEYSFSAEMPREYIMKIADFVDGKMHEIGDNSSISTSGVAVLSAVNMADDYFTVQKECERLIEENDKLKGDAQRYEVLWEEVKQNFAQYKEEMTTAVSERNDLLAGSGEKDKQLNSLYAELQEEKQHNDVLRQRVEELSSKLENVSNAPAEAESKIAELEAKCRDTESSFFDIQIENIRLKNEMDALKRQLGQ